jgi:hypothetical protein
MRPYRGDPITVDEDRARAKVAQAVVHGHYNSVSKKNPLLCHSSSPAVA